MSSRLEGLPTEMLDAILERVAVGEDGDVKDLKESQLALSALCLTSKTLCKAATPYLYRTFNDQEDSTPTAGFIKTISAKATLAASLKYVSVAIHYHTLPNDFEDQELDMLNDTLKAKMTNRKAFYRVAAAIAEGCYTAQLLVLLGAATQMRSLQLSTKDKFIVRRRCRFCFDKLLPGFGIMLSTPAIRNQYDNLQHIVICSGRQGELPVYEQIMPLLYLPSLKTFECTGLTTEHPHLPPVKPYPSSSLAVIKLADADLNTSTLREMLGCTTVLKKLEVRWVTEFGRDEEGNRTYHVDPPAIRAALGPHKSTLRHLTLSSIFHDGEVFADKKPLGSLVDFKLTSLAVDEYLLRGTAEWQDVDLTKVLPPALEALTIYAYGDVEPGLPEICSAIGMSHLDNLSSFRASFNLRYCPRPLAIIEGPFEANEVGCFLYSSEEDDRVDFSCWGRDLPQVLAQFASLMRCERGTVARMFEDWKTLKVDESGIVFVDDDEMVFACREDEGEAGEE